MQEPSREDRSLALLAHGLGIVVPGLGPFCVFVATRRSSKYVAAHALHSAFISVVLNVMLIVGIGFAMFATVNQIAVEEPELLETLDLASFLPRFALGAAVFGVYALAHLTSSAYHMVRAAQGKSMGADALGRWLCRVARL